MTDHAAIVPTRRGPVGVIVTEPGSAQRGAAVVLQGPGPPCRAGVNGVWTRVAADLAGIGLVVLRLDLATEGDSTAAGRDVPRERGWRRCTDLAILRDVVPWFLECAGERDLFLCGSCHGARVALEFAAADPIAKGLFLAVPYIWHAEPNLRDVGAHELDPHLDGDVWAGGPTLDTDDELLEGLRSCAKRGPVRLLVGDSEVEKVGRLATVAGVELDIEPGGPLHPVSLPEQQAPVRRWMVEGVAAALAELRTTTAP